MPSNTQAQYILNYKVNVNNTVPVDASKHVGNWR